MNRIEIQDSIKQLLARKNEIVFAYLFGSFVGEVTYNDIDVAIYIDPKKYKKILASKIAYDIKLALEIEKETKNTVDLIIMNNAPDHLIYSISAGLLIVNRHDDLRVDFITQSWARYFDFKYQRDMYLQNVL